ncbi:ferritin-like domain-containing protein [Nonomuraea sp. NPDC049714]|uniref:ferritin-like domain-containing protein n=1 Tax=Nonomuraea sp. NPDC049714 TaxID=3364357 RepID=UPI0037BAA825
MTPNLSTAPPELTDPQAPHFKHLFVLVDDEEPAQRQDHSSSCVRPDRGWPSERGRGRSCCAKTPLLTIVEQGEGTARGEVWDGNQDISHPDRDEVAHYYRFQELNLGRRYQRGDTPQTGPTGEPISMNPDGVRPMRPNPRPADHAPGSAIRTAREEFNHTYCTLLNQLEQTFNGNPKLLGGAVGTMYAPKAQAQALMVMPVNPLKSWRRSMPQRSSAGPMKLVSSRSCDVRR